MKNCLVKRGSHAKLEYLLPTLEKSAAAFLALMELATGREVIEQAKASCLPSRSELSKFQPMAAQLPDGPTCLCGEPEKEGGGSWVHCDACNAWCGVPSLSPRNFSSSSHHHSLLPCPSFFPPFPALSLCLNPSKNGEDNLSPFFFIEFVFSFFPCPLSLFRGLFGHFELSPLRCGTNECWCLIRCFKPLRCV